VPGKKNDASVLVPCCAANGDGASSRHTDVRTDDTSGSIQKDPATHLQGTGPDVDVHAAGANVVSAGEQQQPQQPQQKRVSRSLSTLLKWRGGWYGKGSSSSSSREGQ
jgi:hypothetical protein